MAGQPRNRALAPDRLGALALLFFVLGAAAPLASTAGGTSTGWAVTGVAGIPIAFLVKAVLLQTTQPARRRLRAGRAARWVRDRPARIALADR